MYWERKDKMAYTHTQERGKNDAQYETNANEMRNKQHFLWLYIKMTRPNESKRGNKSDI